MQHGPDVQLLLQLHLLFFGEKEAQSKLFPHTYFSMRNICDSPAFLLTTDVVFKSWGRRGRHVRSEEPNSNMKTQLVFDSVVGREEVERKKLVHGDSLQRLSALKCCCLHLFVNGFCWSYVTF